jgi:glycosyltransferase involved in cell wall biosynthesis
LGEHLVSIVIPTYNSEKTLASCLESIRKQTYKDIEIIIVDRFSKDRTVEIAKKYGAKVFLEMLNKPGARNYGILNSKGEYVLLADSDFIFDENLVEEVVKKLKNREVDALFIDEVYFGDSFWIKCKNLEKRMYVGNELIESPRVYKRSIFRELLFDEKNEGFDEYDFYISARKLGIRCDRVRSKIVLLEPFVNLGKRFRQGEFFTYYQLKNKQIPLYQVSLRYRLKLLMRNFREYPICTFALLFLKLLEYLAFRLGMFYSNFDKKILKIRFRFDPDSSESGSLYEERMFRGEGGKFVDSIERRFVTNLLKQLKLIELRNIKVLDVGAGGGRFTKEFFRFGFDVVALDLSKKACIDLKKKLKEVEVINGDCEKVSFKENKFDIIFSWRTFKYVSNKSEALLNFKKWLKNGGYLIIEMPNLYNPFYLFPYFLAPIVFNISRRKMGGYFIFSESVSKNGFRKKLEEVGLITIEVKGLFFFPHSFYLILKNKKLLKAFYTIDKILSKLLPRSHIFIVKKIEAENKEFDDDLSRKRRKVSQNSVD